MAPRAKNALATDMFASKKLQFAEVKLRCSRPVAADARLRRRASRQACRQAGKQAYRQASRHTGRYEDRPTSPVTHRGVRKWTSSAWGSRARHLVADPSEQLAD